MRCGARRSARRTAPADRRPPGTPDGRGRQAAGRRSAKNTGRTPATSSTAPNTTDRAGASVTARRIALPQPAGLTQKNSRNGVISPIRERSSSSGVRYGWVPATSAHASDGGESPCRVEAIRHHAQSEDGQHDEGDLASFDRGDGGLKRCRPDHVGRCHFHRQTRDQQPANPGGGEMAPGQHDASGREQRADQVGQQPRSKPGGGQRSHGKTGDRDQRRGFPGSGPGRHDDSLAGGAEERVYAGGNGSICRLSVFDRDGRAGIRRRRRT